MKYVILYADSKIPIGRDWPQHTVDDAELQRRLANNPKANVGAMLGRNRASWTPSATRPRPRRSMRSCLARFARRVGSRNGAPIACLPGMSDCGPWSAFSNTKDLSFAGDRRRPPVRDSAVGGRWRQAGMDAIAQGLRPGSVAGGRDPATPHPAAAADKEQGEVGRHPSRPQGED